MLGFFYGHARDFGAMLINDNHEISRPGLILSESPGNDGRESFGIFGIREPAPDLIFENSVAVTNVDEIARHPSHSDNTAVAVTRKGWRGSMVVRFPQCIINSSDVARQHRNAAA
jgi:hypothetical protein